MRRRTKGLSQPALAYAWGYLPFPAPRGRSFCPPVCCILLEHKLPRARHPPPPTNTPLRLSSRSKLSWRLAPMFPGSWKPHTCTASLHAEWQVCLLTCRVYGHSVARCVKPFGLDLDGSVCSSPLKSYPQVIIPGLFMLMVRLGFNVTLP